MGKQIWKGRKLYIAGYDLSGDMNDVNLEYGAEIKDSTTDASAAKEKLPGLRGFKLSVKGLWNDADDGLDEVMYGSIGLDSEVMTAFGIPNAVVGDSGYFGELLKGQYQAGGKIGEILPFSLSGEGSDLLVRGKLAATGAKTNTGTSTGLTFGALPNATWRMYAAFHVIAKAGTPTLDMTVESDDSSGFTSPTTRITFARVTALGGWLSYAVGPIADNWWRFKWTIGGGSPSLTIVAILGAIQP